MVSPRPTATPLVAYWNPEATATRPTMMMTVATSTSARVNPRCPIRLRSVRLIIGWSPVP